MEMEVERQYQGVNLGRKEVWVGPVCGLAKKRGVSERKGCGAPALGRPSESVWAGRIGHILFQ